MAKTLLRLWNLKLWVALGLVVSIAAGVVGMKALRKEVFAAATTQLLVDSPNSALSNANANLAGYAAHSQVFAQLMTSDQALTYVGKAAGIPGNLIEAVGPVQVNGSPQSIRMPTVAPGEPSPTGKPQYVLNLTQNPELPTIEVYAEAPTVKQAIALANGAGAGLSAFIANEEANSSTALANRVAVRQLGPATGGMVDPGAGHSIAAIIFLATFVIWCALLLWITRLTAQLRRHRSGPHLEDPDQPARLEVTDPSVTAGTFRVRELGAGAYTLVVKPQNGHTEPSEPRNGKTKQIQSGASSRSSRP